jgi:hypothetical protein
LPADQQSQRHHQRIDARHAIGIANLIGFAHGVG